MRTVGVLAVVVLNGTAARAEDGVEQPVAQATEGGAYVPQPIVAAHDTRSQGAVARSWLEVAVDREFISAPEADPIGTVRLWKLRLGVGPPTAPIGPAHDVLGALTRHAARVEATIVQYTEGGEAHAVGGPITFALQRFHTIEPLAIAPLVHVNTGIEMALATPWLGAHGMSVPRALAMVEGVSPELAADGWALRPLSGYIRVDFLACRADHLEIGLEPEMFVPGEGPTEVGVRIHADAGFNLACWHAKKSWWRHVALDAGYRGRVRAYASTSPAGYVDQLSAATQIDFTTKYVDGMFAVFAAVNPADWDYRMIGVRAQLGLGGWFRRGR